VEVTKMENLKGMSLEQLEARANYLMDMLSDASLINAERGMSAHYSGYDAYDIETVDTSSVDKELEAIEKRIKELKNEDKRYLLILYKEEVKGTNNQFYFFAKNLTEAEEKVRAGFPDKWYGANIIAVDSNNKPLPNADFCCFAVRSYYEDGKKAPCSDFEKEARKGNLI